VIISRPAKTDSSWEIRHLGMEECKGVCVASYNSGNFGNTYSYVLIFLFSIFTFGGKDFRVLAVPTIVVTALKQGESAPRRFLWARGEHVRHGVLNTKTKTVRVANYPCLYPRACGVA